jgi:hypothetical protein
VTIEIIIKMACICAPIVGFIFTEIFLPASSTIPFLRALFWGLIIFQALLGFGFILSRAMFGDAEILSGSGA